MGIALSQPVTSKCLFRSGNALFRVGAATMQGWRCNMEDAHTIVLSLPGHQDAAFFGIFDGHGGEAVSKLLAKELVKSVSKLRDLHDPKELRKACLELDEQIMRQVFSDDGSTAVFAVASKLKGAAEYKLTVGNVGDSRVILGRWRNGQLSMIPMTQDHKPTDQKEADRIIKAGGTVQAGRVAGSLALSRAFGDRKFKVPVKSAPDKMQVIAVPDFKTTTVTSTDFLLLACDGIFESEIFTRQGVIGYLHYKLEVKTDLADICAELLEECLKRGSNDNMSAMLVQFTDGTLYNREEREFVPGPYHEGDRHSSFQKAYADDAKESGFTLEQARSLYTKKGGHTVFKDEKPPEPPKAKEAENHNVKEEVKKDDKASLESKKDEAPEDKLDKKEVKDEVERPIDEKDRSKVDRKEEKEKPKDEKEKKEKDSKRKETEKNGVGTVAASSQTPVVSPVTSPKPSQRNSTETHDSSLTSSSTPAIMANLLPISLEGESARAGSGGGAAPSLRKSHRDRSSKDRDSRDKEPTSSDALRVVKSSPAMTSVLSASHTGQPGGDPSQRHSHHLHTKPHGHKATKSRDREGSAPVAVAAQDKNGVDKIAVSSPSKKTSHREKSSGHKRSSSSAATPSRSGDVAAEAVDGNRNETSESAAATVPSEQNSTPSIDVTTVDNSDAGKQERDRDGLRKVKSETHV